MRGSPSFLVVAVIGLVLLSGAAPALAVLIQAAVPLVIAVGVVVVLLRLAWWFTNRF